MMTENVLDYIIMSGFGYLGTIIRIVQIYSFQSTEMYGWNGNTINNHLQSPH